MSNLKVCDKCGWYEHGRYSGDECSSEQGAHARALAAAVPVTSTQLGYGFGRLTFQFHEEYSITIDVHRDGTYKIDCGFCLGDWSLEHVSQWLIAIAATRIGNAPDDAGQEVGGRRHP